MEDMDSGLTSCHEMLTFHDFANVASSAPTQKTGLSRLHVTTASLFSYHSLNLNDFHVQKAFW